MKVKESEKAGLKFNIQKTKTMASGPITSWQIDGETMETVTDFIFLSSLISVDGDYSHEMKRLLILGRKAMRNLDNISKSRDITLLTKVCVVRAIKLLFRRRPPQSNYPPDTVRNPDYGSTLEHQPLKGGISRMAPCRLASTLQSLPPILHIKDQCSVSSYSKGSRGLSVLPRVHCIFTASSISLSLGWRQPGHHYAIRAGRNLPDKEFRYLRTVIVTAAVYRGFDQELLLTDNSWYLRLISAP